MLSYFRLGRSTCFQPSLITKGSSHGQTGHLDIFHPYSQRSQLLSSLVSVTLNSTSIFQYSIVLIWSFGLLIRGQRMNFPCELVKFMTFAQMYFHQWTGVLIEPGILFCPWINELKLRLFLLFTLFGTDIILNLVTQYRPTVPNIKTEQLALILKNTHNSWST